MRRLGWIMVGVLGCSGSPPAPPDPPADVASWDRVDPPAAVEAPPSPAAAGPSWEAVVDDLDARIDRDAALAEAHATDWTRAERVATDYRARFRLTADVHDLLAARQWVDEAFARAPAGSGPWATKAGVHASLHQLDAAAAALDRAAALPLQSSTQQAAVLRARAELARMRGDLPQARQALEAAGALDAGMLHHCARAQLAEKTETLEAAQAHLAQAAQVPRPTTGEPAAWLALQQARIAYRRGALEAAQGHLEVAEAALPGWYATAALAGELHLAAGARMEALDAFEQAASGSDHPEYLARMAMMLAETDVLSAAGLFETARARMADWTRVAPEAMAAHAAQLALAEGDAAAALDLAQRHAATHRDVDALVLLARAQRRAGDDGAARATLAQATEGGWRAGEIEWLCAGGCPEPPR